MSALFWFVSGMLAGVMAAVVAIALWRASRRALERPPLRYALAGAALIVGFALSAAIIYLGIGSPHALESAAIGGAESHPGASRSVQGGKAQSMEAATAGLAARLAREGGTAEEWRLLAQSYEFLGRPEDARRAREQAASVAGNTTNLSGTAANLSGNTANLSGNTASLSGNTASLSGNTASLSGNSASLSGNSASLSGNSAITTDKSVAASSSPQLSEQAEPSDPSARDLERRLRLNPRDAPGWLALASVRRSQRDYDKARAAYLKVIGLNGMTSQAWADYADTLGSLSGGALGSDAGGAIDNALTLDPTNAKALWLRASRAHQEHRYSAALADWKRLKALLPPDSSDVRIVDANIVEARQLAGIPTENSSQPPPPLSLESARDLDVGGTPPVAGADVSGTVSIDDRLAQRVGKDSTLFIYAKAVDSPGPPLAVLRMSVAGWPVSFRLDDSLAMIPSRRLSQFEKVVVEARVSRSGQAQPAAGDLYVTSEVLRPGAGKRLALVINREIG
jgi:cytochrome c-type biogenesis protein CcmH/NrfG